MKNFKDQKTRKPRYVRHDPKSGQEILAAVRAAEKSLHLESPELAEGHDVRRGMRRAGKKSEMLACSGGMTKLMNFAYYGRAEEVSELLEKGANPNARDSEGVSVLMYALRSGQVEIVKMLKKYGADVNAKDKNGNSVLVHAIKLGGRRKNLVEALLNGNPKPAIDMKDEKLLSALEGAGNETRKLVMKRRDFGN